MRLLLLLFFGLELYTLIKLGIETSGLTALLYVFATLALGVAILRQQGEGMFRQLREAQEGRVLGPQLLVDDMAMGLAGLLLVFPGIITDLAALVVMIGPLRRRLARRLLGPQAEPYAPERDRDGHLTIEGEYRRHDP